MSANADRDASQLYYSCSTTNHYCGAGWGGAGRGGAGRGGAGRGGGGEKGEAAESVTLSSVCSCRPGEGGTSEGVTCKYRYIGLRHTINTVMYPAGWWGGGGGGGGGRWGRGYLNG